MHEVPLCRKNCLLVVFLLFCCHCHHAPFPNDVPAWKMWHNDQFVMEAAAPMAPMPTRMLIITLLEGYPWSPCTEPYIFLHRSQPTTNPPNLECPSTRCDLNGRQRLQWCPTPDADADNSGPECWGIVVCSGAGSGAPWGLWEDGGRHGQWGTV